MTHTFYTIWLPCLCFFQQTRPVARLFSARSDDNKAISCTEIICVIIIASTESFGFISVKTDIAGAGGTTMTGSTRIAFGICAGKV
jgi:hypothetical protein